jgi:hypothetical protein
MLIDEIENKTLINKSKEIKSNKKNEDHNWNKNKNKDNFKFWLG